MVDFIRDKGIAKPRIPGIWKGQVTIADDFDAESEEINDLFYRANPDCPNPNRLAYPDCTESENATL